MNSASKAELNKCLEQTAAWLRDYKDIKIPREILKTLLVDILTQISDGGTLKNPEIQVKVLQFFKSSERTNNKIENATFNLTYYLRNWLAENPNPNLEQSERKRLSFFLASIEAKEVMSPEELEIFEEENSPEYE